MLPVRCSGDRGSGGLTWWLVLPTQMTLGDETAVFDLPVSDRPQLFLCITISAIVSCCCSLMKQLSSNYYSENYPVTYQQPVYGQNVLIHRLSRGDEYTGFGVLRSPSLRIPSEIINGGSRQSEIGFPNKLPSKIALHDKIHLAHTSGEVVRSIPSLLSTLTTCDSHGTGSEYGPSTRRSMETVLVCRLLVSNKYLRQCGSLWKLNGFRRCEQKQQWQWVMVVRGWSFYYRGFLLD